MRPALSVFAHLGLLVTSLVGCGGGDGNSSAQQLCNQSAAATCEKNFACGGASALTDLGYTSVADCTKQSQADCANPTCPTGKTYHPEQAQKCIDETKAQSCTDFADNPPASCTQVCAAAGVTPGSGGSSGGTGAAGGTGGGGTSGTGGTAGKGGTSGTGGNSGAGGLSVAACTGTFKACGGDPTGTWDIVSACIEGNLVSAFNAALAADEPSCGSTLSAYSVNVLSGWITYSAGNCTSDTISESAETLAYTPACISALAGTTLDASVCSSLEQSLNSEPGTTATCTYATNCNCHSVVSNAGSSSATYTVSGSTITEDSGSSYDFCVSGNTMSQRQQIEGSAYVITQLKKR
jgi:hypothetical protein